MYDFWIGDINIAPFLLIFTFVVVLPLQAILCLKVKSKITRLLPVIILSVLTIAAVVVATIGTGWNVIFYIVSAIYFGIMLAVCGVVWGVLAIVKCLRQSPKRTDGGNYE